MTGSPVRHERLRLMAIAAIAAAALVATWLRVRGLAFGLPAIYNPDEIAIMSRALAFATGDLNPHNFLYPTLYFYLLFAWEGMYFAAGWLIGLIPSRAAFQQSFFVDPTGIFLAGRMLGVACGVGSVLATWRLGTRVAGAVAGIAAAWFLAIAPFAVRDAHYVKHDVPTTLAVVLAVLAASRLADASPARRTRWLVAAAILSGLATSMHYYAVFVCLPLAWAAWIAWRDQPVLSRAGAVAAAAAVSALAFMAGSPYLAAEPYTALRDIQANRQIVIDRAVATSHTAFASLPAYARMLWNDATGWPVTLLALCGIVVLLRRNWHAAVLVVVFPVVFFLFIGNTVAATRYLNPILPFVAVLAGVTVAAMAKRFTPASSAAAAIVVALAAGAPAMAASWKAGTFFRQTDTRTLALDYVTTHLPNGAGVLVQPYSVPLPESRDSVEAALRAHLGDPARASTKFRLRLALPRWPDPAYRVVYLGHGGLDVDKIYVDYTELGGSQGLSALRPLNVQYLVLKRYNDESAVMAPLVEALGREARRIAVFSPYLVPGEAATVAPFLHNTDARIDPALARPGPVIEIWQLP